MIIIYGYCFVFLLLSHFFPPSSFQFPNNPIVFHSSSLFCHATGGVQVQVVLRRFFSLYAVWVNRPKAPPNDERERRMLFLDGESDATDLFLQDIPTAPTFPAGMWQIHALSSPLFFPIQLQYIYIHESLYLWVFVGLYVVFTLYFASCSFFFFYIILFYNISLFLSLSLDVYRKSSLALSFPFASIVYWEPPRAERERLICINSMQHQRRTGSPAVLLVNSIKRKGDW